MKRIARGLRKFVFENPEPFIVQVNHGGDVFRGQGIHEPMSTITQKHGFGKVTVVLEPAAGKDACHAAPFLIQYHSETKNAEVRGQDVHEPLRTIDTNNRYGAVMVFLTKFYKSGTGQSLSEPLHTITTSPGHFGQISVLAADLDGLIRAGVSEETAQKCTWVSEFIMEYYGCGTGQSVHDPLHTVVTKDRFALITVIGGRYAVLDIFLRMLTAEELKLGQGFPKDYIIDRDYKMNAYPVSERVKRIGNSVVPVMAEALVRANCGYLKTGEREPCVNMKMDDSGQMRMVI